MASLFELPAELRNNIWSLTVQSEQDTKSAIPALLQTCRQIRAEAMGLYTQQNHFTILMGDQDVESGIRWIKTISKLRKGDIRALTIMVDSDKCINHKRHESSLWRPWNPFLAAIVQTGTPVSAVTFELSERLLEGLKNPNRPRWEQYRSNMWSIVSLINLANAMIHQRRTWLSSQHPEVRSDVPVLVDNDGTRDRPTTDDRTTEDIQTHNGKVVANLEYKKRPSVLSQKLAVLRR